MILGSNGFIGKNLKNHFEKLNKLPYEFYYSTRENVDLIKKENIKNYMERIKPDIVINVAGKVGSSVINEENDFSIFNNNMKIITNLLECCKETNVEKLLLFSTYRLFGDEVRENYDESDIEKGMIKNNLGYLESKRIQNIQMELVKKESPMKIVCFVMTNVFGEEDQFILNGRIVPSLITKIKDAKGRKKDLYIDSCYHNEVNLIYVKDIVKMVEKMIESERDEWNKCIGNVLIFNKKGTREIGELAKRLAEKMDYQGIIRFNDNIEVRKTNIMKPNLSKMEALFPDFTFTDIEEALLNFNSVG